MIYFECDYNNGCHEKVLEALVKSNGNKTVGYGYDEYSESARASIRNACGCPDAEIYFISGGTQTNALVIDSVCKLYEGVIAADTGHVNTHESGAIEFTGHKVLTLPGHNGKLDAGELKTYLKNYYADGNYDHMVFPGMVYISWPTELGTIYSKAELKALHDVCAEYEIPLYADGARLLYGLASKECDMTLSEFAGLVDMFYIGGTKCGTLLGEALVFPRGNAPAHEFSMVKQHGALLAKGRTVGVQFDALFRDELYKEIGRHTIDAAEELKSILHDAGYEFYLETATNQQFVIEKNSNLPKLGELVRYGFWDRYDDDHTVIRFCTSWATTEDELKELKSILDGIRKC